MNKGPEREWENRRVDMERFRFKCGYCNDDASVREGYKTDAGASDFNPLIYICGGCNRPNYFEGPISSRKQTPAPRLGREVEGLPAPVASIYDEARRCTGAGAYTACVLACRKLLMHLAAEQGAEDGLTFIKYVEFLRDNHYIPPGGEPWVDSIRRRGNEANHELVTMTKEDASELLSFAEMLLKFIYEFPARLKIKTEDS
ncbi:MAG: DUF4145 domain-containing protein [Caldilineaceae bacterium]|nr:DUF4145 domain-containing protein [Caldilineaceae bacterium]